MTTKEKMRDALNAGQNMLLSLPTKSVISVTHHEKGGQTFWKIKKHNGENGELHVVCFHFNDEVMRKLSEYNIVSVDVYGKGEEPTIPLALDEDGTVDLERAKSNAVAFAERAGAYFADNRYYDGYEEARKALHYIERTNNIENIGRRVRKLIRLADIMGKSFNKEIEDIAFFRDYFKKTV